MAGRSISRRDFLKLSSLVPPAFYTLPNILILIFDSWTRANSSLYRYPRETTPNITRRAEKAIVYHNHYASGHYTYPSTASLLTGVLPWTQKVIGPVQR
jgi:arylsulfatase A-like enzyme